MDERTQEQHLLDIEEQLVGDEPGEHWVEKHDIQWLISRCRTLARVADAARRLEHVFDTDEVGDFETVADRCHEALLAALTEAGYWD